MFSLIGPKKYDVPWRELERQGWIAEAACTEVRVGMPVVVGVVFRLFGMGAEVVAAFLMVGTIGGILMASFLNNSGGAWDNAKKFIETGAYGGKGSETHKAAVVGDTVGAPFKDTAGPSLHVLIKLLSTITLVLAPLFV